MGIRLKDFSRICSENGFTFIGPSPEIIDAMGDKAQAKTTMKAAGVPVIPGHHARAAHRKNYEPSRLAPNFGFRLAQD